MAEIKNTFIKSKMNKDLDDRLVPTGEYRDALNIAISRSEGDDVGALENILGNNIIFENQTYSTCIGVFSDKQNERTFYFLTNYIDSSPDGLSNLAPVTAYCAIVVFDKLKAQNTILVAGSFLNFSARSPITGINLLEDLLFWTDNRNQPRKINIETALSAPAFRPQSTRSSSAPYASPYYTKEDHVSVARYYPWKPISLTNIAQQAVGDLPTASTMTNPTERTFPNGGTAIVNADVVSSNVIILKLDSTGDPDTGFYPTKSSYYYGFEQLVDYTVSFGGNTYTVISSTTTGGGNISITIDNTVSISDGETIVFQKKPDYDSEWAGDPDFLNDRFIRLSYRFKFDDNEYSLMAPFTQPCFIPKQYGYFLAGDQEDAYRSTVVNFFENNVAQIIAAIEFETLSPDVDLKIKEVEILYKESDALQVKVIESISIKEVIENMQLNVNPYIYEYKYISTKPYKGLPEDQITRVYDQVPTRALAQEISSNRVIYGNFTTTNSPPRTIDYYTTYGNKLDVLSVSQIEYPNHTVKQNRNYQVGFVLADRYGRQSSVILSSNDETTELGGDYYGGSTVYVPYKPNTGSSTLLWPGYALRTLVNSPIPDKNQSRNRDYVGLYNDGSGIVDSLLITNSGSGFNPLAKGVFDTTGGTGTGLRVTVNPTPTGEAGLVNIYVNGTGYTDGDVLTILGGNNDATIEISVSDANPLGWYSYKIVVRQTEQDYYNAYLPGILNGYPASYIDDQGNANALFERGETSNVVLINDNINKIPRDLNEVGPDQRQYRSAVKLFGRVSPVNDNNYNYNKQYYPTIVGDTVTSISTLADTNYNNTTADGADPVNFLIDYPEFYQSSTNPLIARINTVSQIGKSNVGVVADPASNDYEFKLAVYETDPTESLLDIYWETTSSGLISDLNIAIQEGGYLGAIRTNGYDWLFDESDAPGTDCFNDKVSVINGFGNVIYNDITFELESVTNQRGSIITNTFELVELGAGTIANPKGFNIQNLQSFYYGQETNNTVFNFTIKCTYTDPLTSDVYESFVEILNQELRNSTPTFHTTSNPLSPIYTQPGPETAATLPSLADKLVLTVYGQNGCYETSGLVANELVWELTEDGDGRFYIVSEGGGFEPGECQLWLRANPEETIAIPTNVNIRLHDAGLAANSLSADLPLQYEILDIGIPEVEILQAPICVPPSPPEANPWNGSTGTLRYAINFTELLPGVTYSDISLTVIESQSAELITDITPLACRIPSTINNPGPGLLDETYYFNVRWFQSNPDAYIRLEINITSSDGIPVIGSVESGTVPFWSLVVPLQGTSVDTCNLVTCAT